MAISLLALDLDGTLLNHRGQISERNLSAIATHAPKAFASRWLRPPFSRFAADRPRARTDVPLISHNGAEFARGDVTNRRRLAVATRRRARSTARR